MYVCDLKKLFVKGEIMDKKNNKIFGFLVYSFWVMLALLVVRMALALTSWTTAGFVVEALFYVSVLFVFIAAIRYLMPSDKSFAVTALVISGVFLMFILLMIVAILLSSAGVALK